MYYYVFYIVVYNICKHNCSQELLIPLALTSFFQLQLQIQLSFYCQFVIASTHLNSMAYDGTTLIHIIYIAYI